MSIQTDILIAEDHRRMRDLLRSICESAGYSVDAVPDGRAAVEAVAARRFGVVLMDIHMPELDGYAATEAIRRLATEHAMTPVIAVTADTLEETRSRCIDAGMDDFLAKPIDPGELLEKLASALESLAFA